MVRDQRIVVIGAGGHALVVGEAIEPLRVVGYLAPEPAQSPGLLGDYLGDDAAIGGLAADGCVFALGTGFVDRGGAERRRAWIDQWSTCELVVVVHPAATVARTATLMAGCFVAAGAVISSNANVGAGSIVNTAAVVDHDCNVGQNVHIGPGAVISGGVTIGSDTLIGVGSTIRQGISIGRGVVIGAGAVVVSDVPDGATAVGVPARVR